MLRERPNAKTGDAVEDFIGGFCPDIRFWILVADLDEFPDRLFQALLPLEATICNPPVSVS